MRPISKSERVQIERALQMTLEEAPVRNSLYFEIGWKYLGGNMMDPSGWTSIGLTTSYLRKIRGTLFEKICLEWQFCSKRNEPDLQDTVNLVAAIADVMAGLTLHVPPILISTLLLKKGLTSFCTCNKEELTKQLASSNEYEREWAVYALASLDAKDAFQLLKRMQTDHSVIVRASAVYSLGQIGDYDSEELIWEMVRTDTSSIVRRYGIEVLSSLRNGAGKIRLADL